MKSLSWGFACVCLLLFSGAIPAGAQQAAPPAPNAPQAPATPQPDADQDTEAETGVLKVPELPKIPDLRMPGERGVWFGANAWFANPKPALMKGSFPYSYPGNIDLQGTPKIDQGFDFGAAVGLHNTLRFSYFQTRASGAVVAPTDLGLLTQYYLQGDYIVTDYLVRSFKLSFDYLTWPYPVKTSKFRLKTLWQVQYLEARTGFAAPFVPTTDAFGNPLTGSDGNPVTYMTSATHHFYLPEVGIGAQEYVSPRLRLEFNAAGFAIPHHQTTWDADATANMRFGHYELRVGVRAAHFKTSPQQDFWFKGNMVGPMIGLRVYTDQSK